MINNTRLTIFPTRQNYRLVTQKLNVAEKGLRLLCSKRDALNQHLLKIEVKLKGLNEDLKGHFKEAFLSLSRARYQRANTNKFIKDSKEYPIVIKKEIIMVSGTCIPKLRVESNFEFSDLVGRGSQQLKKCRELFKKLTIFLIKLASIKSSHDILKKSLSSVNQRINSLEHNIIPCLANTLKFITAELDEQEREEFFRLKKVKSLNEEKKK